MSSQITMDKSKCMHILLVDDDLADREDIKRTISKSTLHANITETDSVAKALSLCMVNHYDIILLDYQLPPFDGIVLMKELEKRNISQSNVVLMMSNSEEEEIALESIQVGAQDFLLKREINSFNIQRSILHAQKRVELEQKLRSSYKHVKSLAEKDPLTSLANRALFEQTLKVAINNHRRKNGFLALVLFDVDSFKNINDNYGHPAGDHILVELALRIKQTLRGNELFARLGGDEFVLVFTDLLDIQMAAKIMARVHQCIQPAFYINDQELFVTISVGISILDNVSPQTSEDLLKQADIAMYRSKQKGHGLTTYFEDSLQKELQHRITIENNILKGISDDEFFLVYQPIIDSQSFNLSSCEALIRWRHQNRIIMPNEFIPIAEDTHKINELGKWIITSALTQLSKWKEYVDHDFKMSINLSAVQLRDSSLISFIQSECAKWDISPENLQFELTETALITDIESRSQTLSELHGMGCTIALDDFGTGFSSISHLINFPITTVKIDKSIIPKTADDSKERKLLEGLVLMLKTIGISSVAEGIENEKMEIFCRQLGVNKLQGFHRSVPLLSEDFENEFLKP